MALREGNFFGNKRKRLGRVFEYLLGRMIIRDLLPAYQVFMRDRWNCCISDFDKVLADPGARCS